MTKKRHIDYQEWLAVELQNPKKARAYLNAALLDEDQRVFLLALKDVLSAHRGDMVVIAEEAQLNRQSLHRMFSKRANPKLTSIRSVLHALGFELAVQPIDTNKRFS